MGTPRSKPSPDALRDRFEHLLHEHRGIVYKVAGTYCRNAEDRQDLVQEISAQLWRSFARYDPAQTFSTWMYRVALNVAISYTRRTALRRSRFEALEERVHEPVAADPADGAADEAVRLLYKVIDRFGPLDRALLLLYLDEHSYRDIAAVLGLTETNVATKLSRLKKQLRKAMLQTAPNPLDR